MKSSKMKVVENTKRPSCGACKYRGEDLGDYRFQCIDPVFSVTMPNTALDDDDPCDSWKPKEDNTCWDCKHLLSENADGTLRCSHFFGGVIDMDSDEPCCCFEERTPCVFCDLEPDGQCWCNNNFVNENYVDPQERRFCKEYVGAGETPIDADETFGDILNDDNYEDDPVNHPGHYTQGSIEIIDFIEDQKMDFREGAVVKYLCRHKHKGTPLQDLQKAQWFLNRLIADLK